MWKWKAIGPILLATVFAVQAQINVTVDDTVTYQTMNGFGAAITESTAWLLRNKMSAAQRTALLQELFSADTGIGLSALRIPIGASDFRLADYTLDDMPAGQTDYALDHFSSARDQLWRIPLLREICAINTNLILIASPWSPPAWMKSSGQLYRGRLNTGAHQVFAEYLMKFIQTFTATGLPIYAVTMQNEPLYEPYAYPGTYMPASQQIQLAATVGRLFQSNAVSTRILCFDHNWSDYAYPITVLNDPVARPFLAGSAFHAYEGAPSAQSLLHNAHPDKEIHFTEMSSGTWAGSFSKRLIWDATYLLIGATRNWAQTVIKWNLALDPEGGPKIDGGCNGCEGLVTIHTNNGTVSRNFDYYTIAHLSAFVQPDARRIDSSDTASDGPLTTAFRNPDASIALIALNKNTAAREFVIRWSNQLINVEMPAQSLATITWPGIAGATSSVWITRGDQTALLQPQSNPPAFHPQTLTINVQPEEAENAGAQWRLDATEWRAGKQSIPLSAGVHTLECSRIIRWIEPATRVITVASNQAAFAAMTYSAWPDEPRSFYFRAVALTNSVVLSWHDPRLSWFTNTTVLIHYSTNDYPDHTAAGTALYTGELHSVVHQPLIPLHTYYYTIWCTQNGSTFTNPP
ncbi:MAG: glycoside hydrolase family 30 beta sandwich domain-containing protein [Kiritimatiellae bacterium]|nr:glycoside hydrolase family 30 beta sandwich domain-containing protein [Kiritimatiellia bacterium]